MNRAAGDERNGAQELEVGDRVDVPGGMHGVVKFIGTVRGKNGVFAGVELDREWATRGKNDGDVDGVRYFSTSIKGAGIFLPSNKAFKRPSLISPSAPRPGAIESPTLLGSTTKLRQSLGGGRVPSPTMRSQRPSLPRPESPLRRQQAPSSTPQPRPSIGKTTLSRPSLGGPPRVAPSPTPSKVAGSFRGPRASLVNTGTKVQHTPAKSRPSLGGPAVARTPSRAQSRSASRLGHECQFDEQEEDGDDTPIGIARTTHAAVRTSTATSRRQSGLEDELQMLRAQLDERDKQLNKYAMDLEEMQQSINEIQAAAPPQAEPTTSRSMRGSGIEDMDAPALRSMVREKNEKISALTHEFDTHRADFRETIDILEHTSDETNRHYEERIAALETELQEQTNRDDDVESVAKQLIQLEKHVEELEEGLEDSRRGESEARAEVEHLRGEVERGKAELRRERERATASGKAAGETFSDSSWKRELAQRDNEINGLKAIIHSLSRDAPSSDARSPNAAARLDSQLAEERKMREQLERDLKSLEGLVDKKTYREEELEQEVQRLQRQSSQHGSTSNGRLSNQSNFKAPSYNSPSQRGSGGSARPTHAALAPNAAPLAESEGDNGTETDQEVDADSNDVAWCELCENHGHDILHCTNMGTAQSTPHKPSAKSTPTNAHSAGRSALDLGNDQPAANTFRGNNSSRRANVTPSANAAAAEEKKNFSNPHSTDMVPGKDSGVIDAQKWCALCEKDGHDSTDCPFDNEF